MNEFLQKTNLIHTLLYRLTLGAITIFYRNIEIKGRAYIPQTGPVIFVANHPNGLIDPLLLMVGMGRKTAFLAKSTLFGNPVGRLIMDTFGALPIFRQRDDGLPGGPQGDASERNEVTFAYCRQLLHQGKTIALFPEGTTHSKPQLQTLKTGAARIALSAAETVNWQTDIQIVPVGLWYENKSLFRTSVLLVVGEPFGLTEYASHYTTSPRKTVHNLTERLETALDQVVLQAENADLLAGIPYLATWVAPDGIALTKQQHHAWTARLLTTYKKLQQTQPDQLAEFATAARAYATTLASLGIHNPWNLELSPATYKRLIWLSLGLILTFPLAFVGVLLNYIPYRLAAPLATAIVGQDHTQISTVKFIGGSLLVLLAWLIEAILFSWWIGMGGSLLLLVIVPVLAYIALRWSEAWRELYEVASCQWLRWHNQTLAHSLMAERQRLAEQVMAVISPSG